MGETFVVTGGAGFIGSHLAERLLKDGHRVHVVDNLLTGSRKTIEYLESLGGDFVFHQMSINDLAEMIRICRGADTIFHQAALPSVPRSVADPLETHEHCVTGTLKVLIAARDAGVRRVIYAASSSAYGDIAADQKVESIAPAPISPYGAAKLAGEYYCQAFFHAYGLETVGLRYFNVFGARQDPTSQYAAVIPLFITAMLDDRRPTIYGDGTQTRDFTYIDNVIEGNLLAVRASRAPGEVMNLATGGRINLLELVEKINRLLGKQIEPVFSQTRQGDIKHSSAGIEKARQLLDFEPRIDFDTGLARTVEWYRGL